MVIADLDVVQLDFRGKNSTIALRSITEKF